MDNLRRGALFLWAALLPWSLAAQAPAVQPEDACPAGTTDEGPSDGALAHVRFLADDALEGREVGTRGERCASAYVAARLAELGLRPAGADGGWYQTFAVRTGSVPAAPGALEIPGEGPIAHAAWAPYGFSGSGDVGGPLVYAGPGVSAPGTADDAYAHLELEGSIAVVEAAAPGARGLRSDPHFKATVAAGRRAAALVLLLPEGARLPDLEGETRPFLRIPVVAVSGDAASAVRDAATARGDARVRVEVQPATAEARNVVALLPGAHPDLRDQVVVVGAHYDHLGLGGEGSLAPDARAVHNGADDNASGTAALIEIARRLSHGRPPARSVLFIAFGGEERGLLGSARYVDDPLLPLERTVAMLNLDMVGRLGDGALTVFGMATASEWEALVRDANADQPRPLELALLPDGFGPSDHASFWGKGIPVLHFFTGTHEDYHRPSDDWERVDVGGLEKVVDLAAAVTTRLAGTEAIEAAELTPAAPAAAPHGAVAPADPSAAPGYGPYFGSIPDMTPQDFGVKLSGVREDSPAARAGLRAGDVIVSFGGKETPDLYAYTYALREHDPGDRVEVVVVRDGQRVGVLAVLGERR